MERKIHLAVLLIACAISQIQAKNPDEIFYNAYIRNDRLLWKATLDQMQHQQNQTSAVRLQLLDYHYGYIGWCLQEKQNKEAARYLALAESLIETLEKDTQTTPHIYIYKSIVYGFKIMLNHWKAPVFGPRSLSFARQALQNDKTNPVVYIQLGNIEYFKPPAFGGSKSEALNYFIKAEKLMESNLNKNFRNWKYLNLLRTIAQIYDESGDWRSSIEYCQKILRTEPGFHWIKNQFYPELLKKHVQQ